MSATTQPGADHESDSSTPPAPPAPFGERLNDSLQHLIGTIVGSRRKPPRLLKSLLNGTWLGHPLHPAITDVPIGAWLFTALFDILWLVAPGTFSWAARGAEATVLLGLAAALAAAATGLTDWSDTYGRERSIGFQHGLFNLIAITLYLISTILRFLLPSGESTIGAIVGFAGLVSLLYAAYLGGEMVFTQGTGVNHEAWEPGGEDFEPVMALADLTEDKLYRVTAGGAPAVLLRAGEHVYAISATCPHAGGPLDEGALQPGAVVECPWHGSRFRMRDGHVLTGPATTNAARYAVRIRGDQVEIKRQVAH